MRVSQQLSATTIRPQFGRFCIHSPLLNFPRQNSKQLTPNQKSLLCSAMREAVVTDQSPTPLGAYSRGIKANGFLFVSGQLGILPGKSEPTFVSDSVAEQTTQAMRNLGAILEAAGSSYEKVVKTTIMMANIDDFKEIDGAYGAFFVEEPPARAAFAAKELPINAKVEIDAIALVD